VSIPPIPLLSLVPSSLKSSSSSNEESVKYDSEANEVTLMRVHCVQDYDIFFKHYIVKQPNISTRIREVREIRGGPSKMITIRTNISRED